MSLFVMTGATSGFGLHAARLLLQNPNHELIVGVREAERASDFKCQTGQDRLTITPLDTSSLASVRNFAGFVRNQCSGRKITALGLNAGMQPSGTMKFTNDGMEECFATNFLGHYYLSQLLQPSLQDNGAIVVTASGAHNQADRVGKHLGYRGAKYSTAAQVSLGELTQKTSVIQSARDRYATSKFCVLLYTFSEPRWRNAIKVRLIAFDPGTVPRTQIVRDLGPIAKFAWQSIFPVVGRMFAGFSTIKSSGAALAKLMSEPDLVPQTGLHVDYRLKTATEAEETHDRDLQNDLVTFCETACQ